MNTTDATIIPRPASQRLLLAVLGDEVVAIIDALVRRGS